MKYILHCKCLDNDEKQNKIKRKHNINLSLTIQCINNAHEPVQTNKDMNVWSNVRLTVVINYNLCLLYLLVITYNMYGQ